ncbi:hypothetical protein L1281_002276 [Neisseria sp. HSC-16F19]|nr:hypothetical protein [Neisseria sp. HSC-16F19]MCP2041665.1 hypothetical protein [Neisseria sp. HSC-16F19]
MSKNTVTVGCKLPNGLVLEVGGRAVTLNGANSAHLIGGHGITHDVDAELWAAWLERHRDRAMVKNGFVFAHDKTADTKAEAKDKSRNKTKLEPLSPDAKENGVATADE